MKTFRQFFIAFLKDISNFEHFGQEHEPHSLSIFKFIDSESCGYLIMEKVLFQNSFQ